MPLSKSKRSGADRSNEDSDESSPSPSPSESRINLPPNTLSSDTFLEGQSPNVFADRALGLHSKPAPSAGPRSERAKSLMAILGGVGTKKFVERDGPSAEAEMEGLLEGQDSAEGEDDENEQQGEDLYRRTSRSRSKSQWRKAKWYNRPSPLWFMPGTFMLSLSMGMTISPKIELFTQLVCRGVSAGDRGAVVVPPSSDNMTLATSWELRSTRASEDADATDGVASFVQQSMSTAGNLETWEDAAVDDTWAKQCRKNPEVQKGVASLGLALALLMGVLSSLTTGYWGALSDRRGRKPVMAMALFGMLIMDTTFLVVVQFPKTVGYRFLLVGPAFDGLLGGLSTATAAVNAYLADCTEAGSRARIFSIIGGLLFGGIAIGPSLGSLVIRLTGSILGPFYVALLLHILYLLAVVVLIPESLSHARQLDARRRHQDEIEARAAEELEADEQAKEDGHVYVVFTQVKRALLRPWAFLRPLALLLPKKGEVSVEDLPILKSRAPPRTGWEWSLATIALGQAFYIIVVSLTPPKLQYTAFKYDWGPIENGYYLSFVGVCRMLVLIAFIPLLFKLFRKPPPLPASIRPSTPVTHTTGRATPAQAEWDEEATYLRVVHDSHFDLFLARISIFIDIIGYCLMAVNHGAASIFVVASGIQSLGGGASPALQSLALAHASPRDTGRLFASLSVLQAITSQIIGPILFNLLFIRTVGFFPELVFWVASLCYVVSLSALLGVRIRSANGDSEAAESLATPSATTRAREEAEQARGRSVTRKPGTLSDSGIVLRD